MESKVGRPHICFVAPSAFPLLAGDHDAKIMGGAELQQVIVARGLAARGYRVSMICLNFGQGDEIEIDGIRVYRAYRPNEGLPVLRFLWPRLTRMWGCLERIDADIYYQRTAGMLTGVVASFCRRRRKKSIFAAAGDPMIRFSRDHRIYEYGLRHVDQIVVQTAAQARHFRNKHGRESVLVPNCCQPLGEQWAGPNGRLILWVSTIRRLKRPGLFLDLARALPEHGFRMVGGPGDGERRLFDTVKASAEKLPNVEFMGFVPYEQIDRHFDAAAVFVNTSETEGYPNTFLQSWVRGIPTVSFIDCEARADGVDVNRVVHSPAELAATVARLMNDDSFRLSQGRLCREYAERVHSPGRILDLYERIFDKLLDAERRGRTPDV